VTASAGLTVADGTARLESLAGLTATGVRLGPAWSGRLPEVVRAQLSRGPLSILVGGENASRLAVEIRPLADGWDVRAITGMRARSGRSRITGELDSRIELDRALVPRAATLAYLSLALKGIRHRGMAADIDLLLSEAAGSIASASGRLAVTASAHGSPSGTKARIKATLDLDGTLALADGRLSLTPAAGGKAVHSRHPSTSGSARR
jgi:hypothetical protein